MKYTSIILSGGLMLLLGVGCKQPVKDSFTIKGTIKGVDSGVVVLQQFDEEERTRKVLDSVVIKNGAFELKGKTESPAMMAIVVKPGNWAANIFVENSDMTFASDTTGAIHYDYTGYGGDKGANLKDPVITGSSNEDAYQTFEKDPQQLKFKDAFAVLNKAYDAEKVPELKEKMKLKFDSLGKLSNAWQLKWIGQYLGKQPSSVAGAYILSNFYQMNSDMPIPEIDALLGKMNGAAKESVYYKGILKSVDSRKAVMVGKDAPEFQLLKRDSSSFKLSSLKGKYVMLDFWASWCKPCREGIPHWKKVYQQYQSKGFEIVSITNDSRRSDWLRALDQEKMPWIQVTDEFPVKNRAARVISQYEAPFLPFYILLDKNGKIIVRSGEEKDIDQKLKEVL